MTPASSAEAERQAERLRRELATTLEEIAANLAPRRIASDAAASVRENTPEWLKRYWALAQSPVGLAIIGSAAAVGVAGTVVAKRRVRRPRRRRR